LNATAGNITTGYFGSLNTANAVITGGSATALTNFSATTAQATNFSTGNAVITGGTLSGLTAITATTGNFGTTTAATLNATAGNITTGYFGSLNTANAVITGGYISALTNATITTGSFGTATAATLNATAGNITTLAAGSLNTANAVISGGYISALTNATITTATITNFASGNLNATGTTNGTWSTANVALYDSVSASSTNGTFYPQVADKATGNVSAYTVSSFNINPSTGLLSATTFSGAGTLSTLTTSGTIIASGNIVAAATTASTNTTTGALVVKGGAGIAGDVKIGTSLTVDNGTYGNVTTTQFGSLFATAVLPNNYAILQAWSPATSGGLGLNAFGNQVYSAGAFNFTTGATVRDKDYPTGGTTGIIFAANGAIINTTGIASTSAGTGAVIITGTGGLGVGGNTFHARSTIMNSSQTAGMDTIIRGVNDSTLIWARPNATYDSVIIGNSATASTAIIGAKLVINTTDSIILPGGTNAQRPSSIGGTDVAGMFRYNITSNNLEFYNGAEWKAPSGAFTVIAGQQFTGDGSTTTFTLSEASTTAATIVAINGVVQIPGLSYAYTVSDTTLTFSEAPASGDIIDARTLTTTAQVSGIGSTTGFTNIAADTDATGIVFKTGTASASTVFTMPPGGGIVSNDANVSVASANSPTTIDTITNATYRSAKYIVQVTNGTYFQSSEALVVQDGTAATIVVYGTVQTNSNLGVLSAAVSGGSTLVQFTAANATNTVRIFKQYIPL